jgi:hypothetical protein
MYVFSIGFPSRDEVQLHAMLVRARVEHLVLELRPVVDAARERKAAQIAEALTATTPSVLCSGVVLLL